MHCNFEVPHRADSGSDSGLGSTLQVTLQDVPVGVEATGSIPLALARTPASHSRGRPLHQSSWLVSLALMGTLCATAEVLMRVLRSSISYGCRE